MIRISDSRLEQLIAEDVPYFDLTVTVLGIGDEVGKMEYFTREDCVLAGTGYVARMAQKLGCSVESSLPDGTDLRAGQSFMTLCGRAEDLHAVWKVGLNVFDHLSAVATKTRAMVDAAHEVNPACEVLTTRKSQPGCKDLLTAAVVTGGAFPHRLGLSETVLVFDHHIAFMGGVDAFIEKLPNIRSRCVEKKLFVESSIAMSERYVRAGVDGIQLDKESVEDVTKCVSRLRSMDPHLTIIAAGGINSGNAAAYAATGVDGLATTAPFAAKPLDMSVRMIAQ